MPILEPLRADLLAYGDLAVPFISAALIGAWYAICHRLEPKLPPWFARIFLGSAKTPTYEPYATMEYVPEYPIPVPHEPTTTADDELHPS